jgi:16S rRNA (adenine1518-N6/adenine1519-N6)-dimethyltransferase
MNVRAKKHLGQHFLKDLTASQRIADALSAQGYDTVLEIGPGMGALTQFLLQRTDFLLHVVEIDSESVDYLAAHYPELMPFVHSEDFLRMDLNRITPGQLAIAGNFPYNISSQILFKLLDNKEKCPELVGMFQREVAQRVCSGPGTKDYGILSVLLQTWYTCEYLFTLDEHAFSPPPKVKSGVIRVRRLENPPVIADPVFYKTVIKTAFNQRRKTLRNSLRSIGEVPEEFSGKRPEQLGVPEFIALTAALTQ